MSRQVSRGASARRAARSASRAGTPKYLAISARFEREIASDGLHPGGRLPGEHELARRFQVSRGTIRQALAVLARKRLIETQRGAGSFIAFDHEPLDWRLGWTEALGRLHAGTTVRVVSLEIEAHPELARSFGLASDQFVSLDRLRLLADRGPISIERSRLPLEERTAGLMGLDFERGSLTQAMADRGLLPVAVEQWLEMRRLTDGEARLLGRLANDPFLCARGALRDARGRLVEHVEAVLDPDHFQFHLALDLRSGRPW